MSATDFTRFQRKMWYILTYFTVCRYYVDYDEHGRYLIKKAGPVRLFIYYSFWVNTLVKLVYLILTYRGYLVEVHFLDQMSIWDWFLCISQVFQETNMWCRKRPLYEIIYANWKIQEQIFRKLGSPQHVQEKILRNDKRLVVLHLVIVTIGCSALVFQLHSTPKNSLNTYAIVPLDFWLLEVLFAIHETSFIFHIWAYQASSIVLCEVFANTNTHIIREMTTVLERLIEMGKESRRVKSASRQSSSAYLGGDERDSGSGRKKSDERQRQRHAQISNLVQSKVKQRFLDPATKATGTEYNIMTLLADYKCLMLSTTAFNSWAGFWQGGTMGSNYGQFVSDVFMMIQLLKEPDVAVIDVVFFAEDASAGMIILFYMLILVSRLYPASEAFLQQFKKYLSHDVPQKKYLRKVSGSMKIIASKLGGYSCKPVTVPKGIHTLMQWYINAALWQRPADRRT